MTALAPFVDRLAGKLSGGMKQKLGLACTLVRAPDLLLLDEPTVGVDPLSRRELWEIVHGLVRRDGLSVLVSTSYMDEAALCERAIVLHEGRVLATGAPEETRRIADGRVWLAAPPPGMPPRKLQMQLIAHPDAVDAVPQGGSVRMVTREAQAPRVGALEIAPVAARFEDGFMIMLRREASAPSLTLPRGAGEGIGATHEVVIEVRDLVRKFGDFTAVNHTTFDVHRGEIFGLLGPNGAGKTTTFRMLCGLLPALTGGFLLESLEAADLSEWGSRQWTAVNYQHVVLRAWREIDDALSAYAAERQRNRELAEALAASREAHEIASVRYEHGLVNFLVALDAQRTLLQAERAYADSNTALRTHLVALYKALGGGWRS